MRRSFKCLTLSLALAFIFLISLSAHAGVRDQRTRTYDQSSKIDARRSPAMVTDGVDKKTEKVEKVSRKKSRQKVVEEEILLPPPPQGPKKVVMVGDISNKAGMGAEAAIGDPLEEMLSEALIKSGRFIIAERPQIAAGLAEQDFAQSGRTSSVGAPQTGKITNAQIMITGAVSEFEASSGGGQQAISYGGFGLGFSQAQAHVAVIIRLVDLTTMQVLDSQRVEGKAKAGGASFSYQDAGGLGGSLGGFKKTPIGQACQVAINQAVNYVSTRMDGVPWQGAVAAIDQLGIIINNGGENGIKIGDRFTVMKAGTEIIDPTTGVSLGSRTQKIGVIEVVSVDAKFSTAKPLEGAGFTVGDIIEFLPPPPPVPVVPQQAVL